MNKKHYFCIKYIIFIQMDYYYYYYAKLSFGTVDVKVLKCFILNVYHMHI